MIRWTSYTWFKPLATLVLAAFFAVYGVDLMVYSTVAQAHAQSVDDLLNEDDTGLLKGEAPPSEPVKPAESPAPKKTEPVVEDEEEEEAPASTPAEEEKPAVKPEAAPADDEEEDEEEVAKPAKPVKPEVPRPVTVLGPRVDGPTKVVSVVFPAASKHKRRAVEEGLVVRDYFRSHAAYTDVPLNEAIGEVPAVDELQAAEKAGKLIREGRAAYDKNDFDTAIEDLDEAIATLGPYLELQERREAAEEAMLLLGSAYVLNGETKDGREVFLRALSVNPKLDLAGKDYPANVQKEFEAAKAEGSTASSGSVTVTSTPSSLPIFMDGSLRGLTPLRIDSIPVGEHFFKVVEPGYKTYYSKMTIYENVSKTLPAKMVEAANYYDYKASMDVLGSKFEHRRMWNAVTELSETTQANYLYLCRVSETSGTVTLEAYYYDVKGKQFKSDVQRVDLASEDLRSASVAFMDRLLSDETEWQTTFFKEEKAATAAAATPVYKAWWLWTIVGVVVAGTALGLGLGLGLKKDKKSSSGEDHGNGVLIRF